MPIRDDLDLALEQLNDESPETLGIYAYACFLLLKKKRPQAVKGNSFGVYITDMPEYSETFEHEIPRSLDVVISVSEILE